MKVADFIHQFPAGISSDRYGLCRVRVFVNSADDPVVVLTELRENNCGPSVTNAAEAVVQSLFQRGLAPVSSKFVEHYEKSAYANATYEALTIQSGCAKWKTLTKEAVLALLDCRADELDSPTREDKRLMTEVARQLHRLRPHRDLPHVDSSAVIQRRLAVEAGMTSKSTLRSAVEAGAGERELQKTIRSDLSLLGEVYGSSWEEYICFSEYPIADGFVDFVVFTGRSRMDVILIEVKGADFNLVNAGHYEEFSAKINQAASQIRHRYRLIYENLPQMRKSFHRVRAQAQVGKSLYNSFFGPHTPLGVDPNKDINVHSVIIGGRTKDDLAESRLRHDYESRFTPKIRVDSWDSFINKLQRE